MYIIYIYYINTYLHVSYTSTASVLLQSSKHVINTQSRTGKKNIYGFVMFVLHVMYMNILILAKLLYFTNLDFPEIYRGFPLQSPPFGVRSCEVAIIWPFQNIVGSMFSSSFSWNKATFLFSWLFYHGWVHPVKKKNSLDLTSFFFLFRGFSFWKYLEGISIPIESLKLNHFSKWATNKKNSYFHEILVVQ